MVFDVEDEQRLVGFRLHNEQHKSWRPSRPVRNFSFVVIKENGLVHVNLIKLPVMATPIGLKYYD
jgi:hypothetical protein